MQVLLNTLYVMTEGSYLNLDHETVKIKVNDEVKLQVPLHHLGSIICIGNIAISCGIMAKCAADGRNLSVFDQNGRFKFRVAGPVSGNILLRTAQFEAYQDKNKALAIAKNIVAGKIKNCRQIILRGARENDCIEEEKQLRETAKKMAGVLERLKKADNTDVIRGLEGEAAVSYFSSFEKIIKADRGVFFFRKRTRRPPQDRLNALLSFLYTLLNNDCVSAIEGVGLDCQLGFLHALRPGRPALSLDIMEELRPLLSDRLALTLINRGQINKDDFEEREGGAVYLSSVGKKKVISAYQNRKKEEITHLLINSKVKIGLIPHIQARILARFLRGDIDEYPPFIYK